MDKSLWNFKACKVLRLTFEQVATEKIVEQQAIAASLAPPPDPSDAGSSSDHALLPPPEKSDSDSDSDSDATEYTE